MKNILCICAKGLNRSKYLALYLKRKGYKTKYGGLEPHENPKITWNPINQEDINWADTIIVVRERLVKDLKKKFKISKNKKIIVLDVTDSKRLIPKEFEKLKELNHYEFQKKWTYPQLRKAIKRYLK